MRSISVVRLLHALSAECRVCPAKPRQHTGQHLALHAVQSLPADSSVLVLSHHHDQGVTLSKSSRPYTLLLTIDLYELTLTIVSVNLTVS